MDRPETDPTTAGEPATPEPPGLLAELGQLGRGVAALFSAQLDLLSAEFGLARAAVGRMALAGIAGGVFALYLGLTLFALLAVALALWLDSWVWALAIVAGVQAVLVGLALWTMARSRRYIGFPETRAQWSAMMRETRARTGQRTQAEDPA